ncbi:helix-turn-helix domain-containing protein [Cohnella zeiphila]|uniref:Response regulator n=1 Tax=Cohnella zeiphila TaxID=2761120 RepID=A0A7X0VZ35_9BACL|nr:helix-turn-helix domain-containing protein [Cohnella zeiphila]MBB6735142.1 response regulator [Cohnella zeiphila]
MLKVMIADDNPIICKALASRIPWEPLGLELAGVCHDGNELLAAALKERPHIILTDIRMPVTDGLQLIEQLRHRGIPVQIVIISGYNDFLYLKKAIDFDVVAYLMKPIQDEELREALRKAAELVVKQEEIELISRSVHELEEREALRQVNRTVAGWLRRPELPAAAPDGLEPVPHPSGWLLCSLSLDENYRLPVRDDDRLSMLRGILEREGMPGILICRPADTLLAAAVPAIAGETVSHAAEVLKRILERERVPFGDMAAAEPSAAESMQAAFLRALERLHGKLFGAEFAAHPQNGGPLSPELETLRMHLSMGDFRGGYRWLEEKLSQTLADPAALARFNSLIRSVVALYAEYAAPFLELHEQLDGVALPALAFSGREHFLNLFRKLYEWEDNDGKATSIIAYIRSNFTLPLTLEEIAKRYHYNAIYLGQLIKRETGMPFSQYLSKLRIERAEEMLRNNDGIKLADLAAQLGFSDVKYFSKVFKKRTGLSPSQYSG